MKIVLLASAAALIATAAVAAPPKSSATATSPTAKPQAATPAETTEAALPPDTSGVTDDEVKKVAMIGAANQKLTDAADKGSDKAQAQAALGSQQMALFKTQGLTMDRYNTVATMAQSNKALAARIAKANPDTAAVTSAVQDAQTAANSSAPGPQSNAAAAAAAAANIPSSASAAQAASQSGVPASANAIDPHTSPTDPSLSSPVSPPGVNDLK
jgi:hypothetical protein